MRIKRLNESIDFEDIVNIMQDIQDEGHDIVIYSANGTAYYLNDVNNDGYKKAFKTEMHDRVWKFRVDITNNKSEYSDLIDFLSFMNPIVSRLKNCGYIVSQINPYSHNKSKNFFDSVEFSLRNV